VTAAAKVVGVTKRYGRTVALDDVSFEVRPNELFALLGPNGAGKTTLIHILCTLSVPDEGWANIAGVDVVRRPLEARRNLGVVFQEPSLDDRLTVLENLDFHGMVYGVPAGERRKRIADLLDLVELTKWKDYPARALSVGMKRRLEIARALVHDSRLLILDEPTVGLDPQSRENIWAYLAGLRSWRDITLIVTTHYIHEVESCDRVCIIDHGKVRAIDTVEGLKSTYGQEQLRLVAHDATVAREIEERYQDALVSSGREIVLEVENDEFVASVLARYGDKLLSMTRVRPSLESVFLALTGRELRDATAGGRDALLAYAKRGGEFTR
jgi:ABC-2 type transport system ATP-binding protein